ncbi:TRAP transporter substrate-binding protein [Bordetella flabilis]|uniref:ABC transporter substrate-binding protein n=1 Tax=Bordetella flabilis TaxID=463014 RepID=A0A193GKB5_9BORD|nr:TRAP transporter substrate-binding protein [Bordetella flabilis]ANN79856.1 ABC transporter substrate-binding protein [Bordetella flabilis]
MTTITRRSVLRAMAASPLLALGVPRLARAGAEFSYKYAHNLPMTHPLHKRAQEAVDRIRRESNGRLEVTIFPNNQLGGDTDMLSQVRSGGIELFTPSALVIATVVPVAAINAVGFAFSDYGQVWKAMDGPLGTHVREKIAKANLYAFEKMWDNGFRQITTSSKPIDQALDLDGTKIRVPVSPLSISMFKALSAAPASLQFSEVYSALQTRIVDAQENPLPIIQAAKLYEVQKYCSLTNHIWDGYWFIANGRAFRRLPPELQRLFETAFNDAGMLQREDLKQMNQSIQTDLESKGLKFNRPAAATFQAQLRQAGFYEEWRGKFGDQAWGLLEETVGKLA